MDGAIYLLEGDGLVAMSEQEYDSESVLQANLADHPRLLSGDQMNADDPRRWLLIEREAAVPDREEDGDRWSADHLFVDQDAIPTIIEVKRSEDTRARRRVVGQMLDYASNATVYWRKGRIREQFEKDCEESGRDPDAAFEEVADEETEFEEFWEDVEFNLRQGKLRMVFVADEIPSELKRIVEFLNEQMSPAEVLAVEVKQYTGEEQTALVPRLIGQTEEARQSKSPSSPSKNWGEATMMDEISANVDTGKLTSDEAEAIKDLYRFGKEEADRTEFGSGSANASFLATWDAVGSKVLVVSTAGVTNIRTREAIKQNSDDRSWGGGRIECIDRRSS